MSGPDSLWFRNARFGLFLHWGLYALDGIHEQEQWRCKVSRVAYAKRIERFHAEGFDAESWVTFAKSIGAGYLVFTTKHHDGFCLWDSDETSFKSTNAPAKRDFVAELAAACERHQLPLGLYYSVVDWKHPNYPNADRHHELPPQPTDQPDWARYCAYLKRQCWELCSRYGRIALWWWDMNVPEIDDPSINAALRQWQPGILINNRGMDAGDFKTPEREVLASGLEARTYQSLVEACESVSPQAWCHRPNDALQHAPYLIGNLSTHLAKGGNYLLNLGPMGDGRLPERACARVREVGSWFQTMRKALTATPVSEAFEPSPALYTRSGNTLYLILTAAPKAEAFEIAPLNTLPDTVTLLNDGTALEARLEWLPMRFHKTPSAIIRIHGMPSMLPQGHPLVLELKFSKLLLPNPLQEKVDPIL
jgi:alpha-L-fucosidase